LKDKEEKKPVPVDSIIPPNEPESNVLASLQDNLNPLQGFNLNIVESEEFKEDTELIIISKDGGRFGVCNEKIKFVKSENGEIILKKIDDKDEKQKELIADFIVSTHEKEIKNNVSEMVKTALKRKPLNVLKKLKKESKKGNKSKLHTRRGCVFLQIGNEAVNL